MVVVKGSVTPKVSSCLWLPGSGPEAISSSRWFCQKQRASATPKAAAQTMSRLRSSSRCSTRLRRSSWETGPMRRDIPDRPPSGSLIGDRLLRRGSLARAGLRPGRRRGPLVLIVVLAADRAAELADSPAQRATQLRQAFRTEHHQGDYQDDDYLEGTDVSKHRPMVTGAGRDRITSNWACRSTRFWGFLRYPRETADLNVVSRVR